MNETNYYHKIKVMKPVDAARWADENPDIVEGLDENSAAMLKKKLIKQDSEPDIGSPQTKPTETKPRRRRPSKISTRVCRPQAFKIHLQQVSQQMDFGRK